MNKQFLLPITFLASLSLATPIQATNEQTDELDEIVVNDKELAKTDQAKPNVLIKTANTIQNELIRDTRDLVRYTTDVGISDNGRHTKGFAMRGVEGNRVGISIDGVSIPDFEENSLYALYGNFNQSRLTIDSELVQSIDLTRGSDSLNSGSGSLGGGINYHTLKPFDLIQEGKNSGGLLRGGYTSKNREWTRTAGVAYAGEKFDIIALYSQRTGHEMDSTGEGEIVSGNASQHPDPAFHRHHSYLVKAGYQLNPNHRIGFAVNGQDISNFTDEKSYQLLSQTRKADDQAKRINANLYYLYTPQSDYLSLLKLDLDYQKTDLAAVNYKFHTRIISFSPLIENTELSEIADRRMQTDFKRIKLKLDSLPLNFKGEHNLALDLYYSERLFKNINKDTLGIGSSWETTTTFAIQYPVKTTNYGIALKDHIHWYPTFSNNWKPTISNKLGIRYDYTKTEPKDLNAACNTACTAAGKPKPNHFNNLTGFLGLELEPNATWKVGYNLSTGYRVPTASEMYFTFEHTAGTWKANPDLKAEQSISHTLYLQADHKLGSLDINLYQTNYRNFLLEQENIVAEPNPFYDEDMCDYYGGNSCNRTIEKPVWQMVNIDRARIRGLETKASLNLDQITQYISQGWKLSTAIGYSKGKLSSENSLLSIQPIKVIAGLDYIRPDGKWGIFSRVTYLGAKKAKDALVINNTYSWRNRQWLYSVTPYKYLNNSVTLFDVFGFYKPTKNITLRSGVYNLFNRKYHTWDALRGINANGTTNTVDNEGKGLERFKAPGRNYSVSLEIRF